MDKLRTRSNPSLGWNPIGEALDQELPCLAIAWSREEPSSVLPKRHDGLGGAFSHDSCDRLDGNSLASSELRAGWYTMASPRYDAVTRRRIVMSNLEAIYQAIQGLPLHDRLQLVERIAHDAARSTIPTAASTAAPQRGMGAYAGKGFVVPDDFDDPLPPDMQRAFEGEDEDEP